MKKKNYSAAYKLEVALAALKGDLTQAQLSSKYELHATQIINWKKQAIEAMKMVFGGKLKRDKLAQENGKEQAKLYEEIGRLKVELDWLKKNLTLNCRAKKMLIDANHSSIPIARQCDLLGLSRSSYYDQYTQANDTAEKLMRLIDERYTEYPFEGSRRIAIWLQRNGHEISRDQVRYLMRKMGLKAIYPKPNTSAKNRFEHAIYPCLLNKVCVYYPNQVWCSDITYIRMKHGHI